jgi:diguanylate cyclase (GGDEF)-like protein/PAS domain S-box-containing protein
MGGVSEALGAVRVLVVEDDRASAMVVERHLAAIASVACQVEVAPSLAGALARLERERFDLIIADLHLPDSPGAETIARLVAASPQPVIGLTIDGSPELRARALASGAFDYLVKGELADGTLERPVRLAALQARMMHSLRASEARLRAIVNAEPECVQLIDQDTRVIEMNPAGVRLLEAGSLEAVRGRLFVERVAPEHREAFGALVRRAAAGEPGGLQFELIGLAGTRRWMETRVVPLRDETSDEDLVLGIARDISAQKRAEIALQESEARFRKLTELSSDWYWEQDADFRLTFLSTLLEDKTGLAPAAYLGRRRWDQPALNLTPLDWASHRASLERQEPFRDFEMQRPAPDGDTRWLSISGEPVFDAEGRFWGYRGIGRDITDRKRAEQALRDSEARFRSLVELSSDFYWETDREHRMTRTTHAEKHRPASAPVLGRARWELPSIHPDEAGWAAHRAVLEAREPFRDFEIGRIDPDGEPRFLAISGEPMFGAAGEFLGYRGVGRDITERREREAALQRFRTALDSSADMVLLFDLATGGLVDFNQAACRLLGYSREELLGLRAWDIRANETREMLCAETAALLRTPARASTVSTSYRRKDGSTFPVESHRSLLDTPQGRVLVVNSRDLSERMSAEKRRATQARYQKKIARLGQSALSKRHPAELIAKALQSVLEGLALGPVAYLERSSAQGELVLRRVAGLASMPEGPARAHIDATGPLARMWRSADPIVINGPWHEAPPLPFEWMRRFGALAFVPVPAPDGPRGFVCALAPAPGAFGPEETRFLAAAASMVSAALHRLDSEARLAYLAQYDPLTGLANRALLADRFSLMIVQARRRGASLGVLFIDLDDFKLVNDTQGHAAGDVLLKEAARRLQSAVREGDTVARISGDEFAVILTDLARPDDAAIVAQKIIDRLAAPVDLGGQEAVVTASIGIATFPADGSDAEALLGAADAAMYRAKQSGRNAFQFFTADINQRTRARAQMGLELRRALERREFALVYQPKIDLASGQPCGAEALLRWDHPERGRVAPAEFIPVLEETGLIVPVGEWVLRRACEDLKSWQRLGAPAMPVAVNLSARQFRQHDLESRIRAIVAEAGIPASLVELEITESQLMHDPDHAIRMLRALGEAGVRIAIDDFGTGYSSLAYLTRFPLASLKIDRSFVADVLDDEADATIVRTIVDMAHTLGFTVVAEGVERDSQAAFLRALGCEQAQGFLFARPMPAEEFSALLGIARLRPRARKSAKS